ncbi:MAG: tetratricopeptide repeat protein [Halieaceae bacterium]|nr:tetratricopeptide repeat protein [Halieaceae bacterium]
MFPLLLSLTLVFTGCASSPTDTAAPAAAVGTAAPAQTADPAAEETAPEPPERAFPDDSLYPLLVAEFALRRRRYDTALENYLQQAPRLADAGVAAHTARLAQFMRREAEALEATRLWVALEPENLEARLNLANLLALNGQPTEAFVELQAIARAGGMANFTSLLRGYAELDYAEQVDLLQQVRLLMAELPDNIQLRISQVLMLETLGRKEEALAQLQPVFELEPLQLQAVIQDAKLRLDLGQTEGVFDRIEAALKDNPDNNRLRLQYARLLTQTDMAEAERQFQQLLEIAPRDPDLLFSVALIQRELRDLDSARENLQRLLSLNQRTDEAHYYLGKTAEEQGLPEEALMHYMQVQPGRDFGAANERLARLLLSAGRNAELGAYFDTLRQRFPQLAPQLFALEAEKLMGADYLTDAAEVLNRALATHPDGISLRYSRSILAERLGNFPLAEQDLRYIIERDQENSTALNALGYMLTNRSDRYTEALDLIEKALALSPDEPAILDSMGWVKYRLGDLPAALTYLQRAYQAFPDPEVAAHLGEVLWMMGEQEAAREIWDRALAERPDHRILQETLDRLGIDLSDA